MFCQVVAGNPDLPWDCREPDILLAAIDEQTHQSLAAPVPWAGPKTSPTLEICRHISLGNARPVRSATSAMPVGYACGVCLWGLPVRSACAVCLCGLPVRSACAVCLCGLPVRSASPVTIRPATAHSSVPLQSAHHTWGRGSSTEHLWIHRVDCRWQHQGRWLR